VVSEPVASVRASAVAFFVATLAALVVDAVLQLALDAVRVSSYSGVAPWWVTANLVARGRWVVLAALLWRVGPRVIPSSAGETADLPGATDARVEAWRQVGIAVIVLPLLWALATWMVTALRFTLLASWATDGRVFLSPDYYRGILVDYVPWLLAGMVVLGARKHL
ncbi:MAG: hypothetical protein OEW19_18960, partial [Acidobacteriota bacterium]|nr:hypothetical protein [Acidobacteriota bacterium]